MQSILIFAMLVTLLLLPGVSRAETDTNCLTGCGTERVSREANCPPPGDDADQARAQCMRESQDTFRSCLTGCMQAAPADAPANVPADAQPETPPDAPPENN